MRAAARRNLEKARAAAKEVRYRLTPRRLAACAHARQERIRQCSLRRFAPAGDVRGTCAQSAERTEAYDALAARFKACLQPATQRERRIAQALADAAWKRLRVLRLWAIEEALALKARLTIARDELERAALPIADTSGLADSELAPPVSILEDHLALARLVLYTFGSPVELIAEVRGAARRFEQVCEMWLLERGEADWDRIYSLPEGAFREWAARWQQVTGEALLGPRQTELPARQRSRQPRSQAGAGSEPVEHLEQAQVVRDMGVYAAGLSETEWPLGIETRLRAGMREAWVNTAREVNGWPDAREDYERLLESIFARARVRPSVAASPEAGSLAEEATEAADGQGNGLKGGIDAWLFDRSLETAAREWKQRRIEIHEGQAAQAAWLAAKTESPDAREAARAAGPKAGRAAGPNAAPAPVVDAREVAAKAWERLGVWWERADEELRQIEKSLSEASQGSGCTRATLWAIVKLFRRIETTELESLVRAAEVRRAWLAALERARVHLDGGLDPSPYEVLGRGLNWSDVAVHKQLFEDWSRAQMQV
jgi:hypothetical protein